MGEFSTSDCSWKKIVIAKADDQWTSTIKTEKIDSEEGGHARFGDGQVRYRRIKREHEVPVEVSIEEPYTVITEVHGGALHDTDPLLLDHQPKRRRRAGSGPKNESPDERAARLAKMSAYAAQRLANESPEQRAVRLKRMSEYAAKRLKEESTEERARRLARMSAYAARRLAKETPEQRQARLTRMSAYTARRQAMKKIFERSSPSDYESVSYFSEATNNMPGQS